MPDLYQTLHKYDLGHLRIIAELWGLDLHAGDVDAAAQGLCASLLDPAIVRDTLDILPAEARAALTELSNSKVEWAAFARKYGEMRDMGAGKRDRELPHLKPSSTTEILFYRGILAKAFFDSGKGAQEFAYIPDDLLPLIKVISMSRVQKSEPLGRAATPAEKRIEIPRSDRLLDDATTYIAALRVGRIDWKADPRLSAMLTCAKIIRNNTPQAEAVKTFLESSRAEALDLLHKAWLESQTFDELRLIPGISCEGEWTNSPLETRRTILGFIHALPKDKWWSLAAFLRDLKTTNPDFQRPAGDYDSWFIRRESDGQYLRGFACWDEVDGAVASYIIQMLHWLGRADLACAEKSGAVSALRISTSVDAKSEEKKISISSNGKISVPRLLQRAVRYQLARFCEWGEDQPDEYRYQVTARSLSRAQKGGLKPEQLLALLVKHTNGTVPPALVKALKRWEAHGTEARVESVQVLRVTRPEALAEIRKSRAGKFLGEILSPTAVVVKEGAIQKVMAALAELGLLSEVE